MQQYAKERSLIKDKYAGDSAKWYRKSICFGAKNIPFNDRQPVRNMTEGLNRAVDDTHAWVSKTDEETQASSYMQ